MSNTFCEVDRYFIKTFVGPDKVLENVLVNNQKHNLPAYDVSPSEGKLLYLLTKMNKAKRILEIGTLGGYSTICLLEHFLTMGLFIRLNLMKIMRQLQEKILKTLVFPIVQKSLLVLLPIL